MHLLSLALLWIAAFFGGVQQPKARLEFFARAEGNQVRAVVRIKIAQNWHLYAESLGDPNAIGLPTVLTLAGEGVTWGAPRWPEPHVEKQPFGQNGEPASANIHSGTVLVYVVGELAPGADLAAASVAIDGQTCEEGGQCLQYEDLAKASVPGTDAVFASFPSDLTMASAVAPKTTEGAEDVEEFEEFEDPEAHVGIELFTRAEGDEVKAVVRIAIEDTWHIFHEKLGPPDAAATPTVVKLGGAGIEWGTVVWPEPHKADQPFGLEGEPTWVWQHEGDIVLYARGKLAAGAKAEAAHVEVSGQACDPSFCVQFRSAVRSAGVGPDTLFAKFPSASVFAAATNVTDETVREPKPESGLLEFLGLAVFWGVFSLLMPCTYPMIPITISFFTKQASQAPSKRITLSALYGLGIVLMFILIGVVIGAPIIQFATHPVTNIVIGVFFVVFALSLLGLFNLEPPAFLMNMAGQARSTGGYLGVFFMGATLVITSFTCTAPFVGSLLSVGASSGNWLRIVLGMGTFGLTMALPFVALSLVPGKISSMPRAGEWMNTLKVTLGFVEFAAALKFISNADVVYQWGILPREMFLMLWFGILLIAALYLFGLIRYHGESGEIGGGRLVAGMSFFCFSLYCLFGALGNRLDVIMTAVAPPYSAGRVAGFESSGAQVAQDHEIVKDDYEGALALAIEQKKLLFVNFTGFT